MTKIYIPAFRMFPIGYYIASSSFEISLCQYSQNLQSGGRVGQQRGCGEGHSTVLQMFGFDKWMEVLAESGSPATVACKLFMNISLDSRQRTLNLILFSFCTILVPSFQCTKKRMARQSTLLVFEKQQKSCSRNQVNIETGSFYSQSISIYCSIPFCFLPFRIRLLGCPYLEVLKYKLISSN